MKPEHKLGLIAVAIVGGLFAVVGVGVAVLARGGAPSASSTKAGIVAPTGLAAHRWWGPGMTDEKLERIVQTAIDAPSTKCVIVKRDGSFSVHHRDLTYVPPAFKLTFPQDRRPTRDEVVAEIGRQLDLVEYRDR